MNFPHNMWLLLIQTKLVRRQCYLPDTWPEPRIFVWLTLLLGRVHQWWWSKLFTSSSRIPRVLLSHFADRHNLTPYFSPLIVNCVSLQIPKKIQTNQTDQPKITCMIFLSQFPRDPWEEEGGRPLNAHQSGLDKLLIVRIKYKCALGFQSLNELIVQSPWSRQYFNRLDDITILPSS